ncbi:MAG: NAD-dependent epimerase/dehydratase family protein [Gemmatimonadota bacterium]
MKTRRDFIRLAAAGGVVSALPRLFDAQARSVAPQRILVLGGTGFIGPHLVHHAVSRGHQVSIFTRGRREAGLPASVERLVGDRDGRLDALQGRSWDVVIDDSATNPDWVRQSTSLLAPNVGRYMFTSSTGVYYPYLGTGLDESIEPRSVAQDPNDGSESYGVRKTQCEHITRQAFGDRALVVRPTYIVGPGDTTDRFPYWPVRLARGGETLAPGRRTDPVQIIDVRDLVEFMLKLLEDGRSGTFNVAGPRSTLTISSFLDQAAAAIGSTSRLVWVDDYIFLAAHGIRGAVPWIMLEGNNLGHTSIRNDRAVAAGLGFRPLATTVRDTLSWWPTVPEDRRSGPRFAISRETEAAALTAWKTR